MDSIEIQKRIRRWVESRLGMAAMVLHERGMRTSEENIELGQCCGVTREEYHALVDHVFDKPIGDIQQELGGAALTLLACADGAGYVLSQCADKELERIESLPPEKFRKRQAENVANGIGAPAEEKVFYVNINSGGLWWDGVRWSSYHPDSKITIIAKEENDEVG